jgi:hypothetical protein
LAENVSCNRLQTNINEFFRKKKINVLTVKELFDFVVDPTIERGRGEEEALVTFRQNSHWKGFEPTVFFFRGVDDATMYTLRR